jgi:hypothetical protein
MPLCHLRRLRSSQGGVKLNVSGEYKTGVFTAVTVKTSALCEVASCIFVTGWLTYFSETRATLQVEAARSFETSIHVSETTWRHIPKDSNFNVEYMLILKEIAFN